MDKRKLGVWIVNQYSVTPDYPASTRHYELAKYLTKDYAVLLWGSNFIHHNKVFRFSKWTLRRLEPKDGFYFSWLGSLPYKGNGISRMLNMVLFAVLLFLVGLFTYPKPKVIIGSSPTLFTAFSCMLLSKVKRTKFILEIRDLWPDSLIEISSQKQNSLVIWVLRWMERMLYQEADTIITLTKGIQDKIISRGVSEKKALFLPNGIDVNVINIPEDSQIIREQIRGELGLSDQDFVFMYAGAHGPANDLSQIILAANELKEEPKVKLILIGSGSEKASLKRLVTDLKLSEKVILLPAVSKEEVYHYLLSADAYIISLKDIPLFQGALPNKLFDYILLDKPIISTVRGEIEDFLLEHHLGFYGNMKEQGDFHLPTLMKHIASGKLRIKSKIKGIELIQRYYSRECQAEQLSKLIAKL